MASSILKSLKKTPNSITYFSSSSSFHNLKTLNCFHLQKQTFSNSATTFDEKERIKNREEEFDKIPTEGISRPMSQILKQLNKKVPDSVISVRVEDGVQIKYIPWHIVNRVMNLHAPEWSGEVRNIMYSADGKSVTVVYRVTLHGTDAEIHRESTGTALVEDKGYGDAVQKAEGMAFRRACARLGLGLHLYHEDMS